MAWAHGHTRSIVLMLGLTGLFGLFGACKGGERPADSTPASESTPADPPAPLPTNEAEFLAELAPLPDGASAIEVRYQITQVTGSALTGEMTITLAAGGNRREHWQLLAGTGAAALSMTGLRIVTPDLVWIANEGAPGELSTNHLGALARAYLQLPEDARTPIVESIRAWHRMLAEQRTRDDSATAEVLGVTCLQTRIAAQNVCMWEETGLLLRYEGSAFRIEATHIDRAPKLGPDVFALPPEAKSATPITTAEQNYEQVLQDVAAGSYGSVSALLFAGEALPALRMPEPAPTEPAPHEHPPAQ
jgi:hypothetical protein